MMKLRDIEFWTSGTDAGCEGRNYWCSSKKRIINRNMSWSKEESGDCVSVIFTNSSTFNKVDCGRKINYICEVI
jgi:hypothetical protein